MEYSVYIYNIETDEVVDVIGENMSLREAEKVERGININLNHQNYHTCVEKTVKEDVNVRN